MKDWDQSALYMFEAIKRIEKRLESLDSNLREHMEQEESRLRDIELNVTQLQRDVKWHAKVAAVLGSVGGVVLSFVFSAFHRS